MSGQQATTLAGQVIGGAIGGGAGAAIGGLVGSVIGGALFNKDDPPDAPKPNLADGKHQTSAFGGAVPILFGTYRFAGNVIWCSDIRTVVTVSEIDAPGSMGKGGGKPTVEETEYFVDVAIALCEGIVTQIERIYGNGVLIWDASSNAMPGGLYLRDAWIESVTEYLGTETQLPDPTIEAAVGVGNTSAYRGVAYVVLKNLNLTALKTTVIPNFEFVATRGGVIERFHSKVTVNPTYFHYSHSGGSDGAITAGYPVVRFKDGVIRVSSITTSDGTIDSNNIAFGAGGQEEKVELYSLDGDFLGLDSRDEFEQSLPNWRWIDFSGTIYPGTTTRYGRWTMGDGTDVYAVPAPLTSYDFEFYFGPQGTGIALSPSLPLMSGSPKPLLTCVFCEDGTHLLAVLYSSTAGSGQNAFYWYLVAWTGSGFNIVDEGTAGANVNAFTTMTGGPMGNGASFPSAFMEKNLRDIWTISPSTSHRIQVYEIRAGVLEWAADYSNTSPGLPLYQTSDILPNGIDGTLGAPAAIYAENGICCVIADKFLRILQSQPEVVPTGMPLSQVVTELCTHAGLDPSEVDASALDAGQSPAPSSSTVRGFLIAKTSTAKAAIESLRPGYFFDVVDSEAVKFVPRGASATHTLAAYYLGAGEDDPSEHVVQTSQDQPTELPFRVNIRYVSASSDYQWGAQSAQRQTAPSVEVFDGEVPCVFEDWEAAVIAENNLRDIWASAGKRSFSSGLTYSRFEPTDVVFLDDGDSVRQVRLTRREDKGCLISWEAEDIDALMYEARSSQLQFSIGVPPQTIAPAIPSNVEPLDLPPLTETPYGSEIANYVAAAPFLTGPWAGAHIQLSRNDGLSFAPNSFVQSPSVIGVTISALRAWTGGNMFDTTSRIRVFTNGGVLTSSTHDAVLNGANACVIGSEIVQFVNATLVAPNTYELTQFLRGRKGTDWAISSHASSERFVLLSRALTDLRLDIGDRNSPTLWVRAVGTGSASRYSTSEPFSTQLARVMPYSPVHLTAVRLPSAEWHLRWGRRDRYRNDWNSGTDVPLSEADERYDVEVYSGTTLLQTYPAVTVPELILPASVLGTSPTPTSITFKVWQLSSLVGRGFEAVATITQAA